MKKLLILLAISPISMFAQTSSNSTEEVSKKQDKLNTVNPNNSITTTAKLDFSNNLILKEDVVTDQNDPIQNETELYEERVNGNLTEINP